MGYIYEDGKKFWETHNGTLERQHDDNFFGARFKYKRCPFCNRITSLHNLHWFNHLNKCAPIEYSNWDLLDLKYKKIDELNGIRIGRTI